MVAVVLILWGHTGPWVFVDVHIVHTPNIGFLLSFEGLDIFGDLLGWDRDMICLFLRAVLLFMFFVFHVLEGEPSLFQSFI